MALAVRGDAGDYPVPRGCPVSIRFPTPGNKRRRDSCTQHWLVSTSIFRGIAQQVALRALCVGVQEIGCRVTTTQRERETGVLLALIRRRAKAREWYYDIESPKHLLLAVRHPADDTNKAR